LHAAGRREEGGSASGDNPQREGGVAWRGGGRERKKVSA